MVEPLKKDDFMDVDDKTVVEKDDKGILVLIERVIVPLVADILEIVEIIT